MRQLNSLAILHAYMMLIIGTWSCQASFERTVSGALWNRACNMPMRAAHAFRIFPQIQLSATSSTSLTQKVRDTLRCWWFFLHGLLRKLLEDLLLFEPAARLHEHGFRGIQA